MSRVACFVLLGLVAVAAATTPSDNQIDSELQVEGRGVRDMMQNVWNFFFGEGDDYDYDYAYDFDPSQVSSYTWYDPSSARRDSIASEDEEDYSWGEVALGSALALASMGILAAAFPTGLFTIAVKKRSFDDDDVLARVDPTELPLLRSLQEGDLLALTRLQCQRKLFCELSQLGKFDNASFLQKAFYYVSHLTPDRVSRRFRMQRLLEASRENQCQRFSCHRHSPSSPQDSPSNHLQPPNGGDLPLD